MSTIPNQRAVEEHLTYAELAVRLSVSVKSIRRWVADGRRTQGRRGIYPIRRISRKLALIPGPHDQGHAEGNHLRDVVAFGFQPKREDGAHCAA
jgi:hypothetical protein